MNSDPGWSLDPQLARDSAEIGELALCQLRAMNDANYPWLLLVPRRRGVSEIFDLAEPDRQQLMREVSDVSEALQTETACHKVNVAAIGNVVAQLHVHVIARFRDDAAWPKPVWGFAPARPYDRGTLATFIAKMKERLSLR